MEDLRTGEVRHTSSAFLTFVALGEDGRPVEIPQVVPETPDEQRRFLQAGERRQIRLDMKDRWRR